MSDKKKVTDMSYAWDLVHRRHDLTARILNAVRHSAATDVVEQSRPAISEVFGSLDRFLLELQRQWFTELEATLDATGGESMDVDRAWAKLSVAEPAIRLVLDSYADRPILRRNEQRLLYSLHRMIAVPGGAA